MYAKPVVEVVNFEETEIVVNLNVSGDNQADDDWWAATGP